MCGGDGSGGDEWGVQRAQHMTVHSRYRADHQTHKNRHIPVSPASQSRNHALILCKQSCLLRDWQMMCLSSPHPCTVRSKGRLSRPL